MSIRIVHEGLNPNYVAACELLRARGIDVRDADRTIDRKALYVLKSSTDRGLAIAREAHESGARTLNPFLSVRSLGDKLETMRVLAKAGLPVPTTWPDRFEEHLRDGPIVIKPIAGSKGRGVRVVHRAEELFGEEGLFAQRFLPNDGRDRKLYVARARVFGVLRPWPVRNWEEKKGERFDPTDALVSIAFRVGEICDLSWFGVDVVMSDGRPFIVDVNKSPGFAGVPDAPRVLADHLENAL